MASVFPFFAREKRKILFLLSVSLDLCLCHHPASLLLQLSSLDFNLRKVRRVKKESLNSAEIFSLKRFRSSTARFLTQVLQLQASISSPAALLNFSRDEMCLDTKQSILTFPPCIIHAPLPSFPLFRSPKQRKISYAQSPLSWEI